VVNSGLDVNRALSRKAMATIKRLDIRLRAELNAGVPPPACFINQALENHPPKARASERRQHRHPSYVAIGEKAPGTHHHPAGPGNAMYAAIVRGIELELGSNALLVNKHFESNRLTPFSELSPATGLKLYGGHRVCRPW